MKIVLENLTKEFPSRNKKNPVPVVAVNHVNIEIPDGKLIGLLGPSGCGKSTTLYMLCGLQRPTEGKIYFGDKDVTTLEPQHRGVGLVFQNYALYPHLTVKQNILFPLQNFKGAAKLSKQEMLDRAEHVASLVQISELMDRKPSELSGGQQQRVAIARALVKQPRVLLLDEPLSNLDARLRLQTREEIRRIQRETGVTTVFVTHDQEEAMSISDMIVVMKLGVVQQIGAPQDVYDDPANLFVAKFLGTPPINVFDGELRDGHLYIGDEAVMPAVVREDTLESADAPEQPEAAAEASEQPQADAQPEAAAEDGVRKVVVGIRPEGFILNPQGKFGCTLRSVEIMGRDCSFVLTNEASQKDIVRAIVDAANRNMAPDEEGKIHFDLKPNKVFIFDANTEKRIYIEE